MHHQNVSWKQAFSTRTFLRKNGWGKNRLHFVGTSIQFEEKYSNPRHKEANPAIFCTSAVITSKLDPSQQDQTLLILVKSFSYRQEANLSYFGTRISYHRPLQGLQVQVYVQGLGQ